MKINPPMVEVSKQSSNDRTQRGMRPKNTKRLATPAKVRRELLERSLRIHDTIASGKYPNIRSLAEEFEISEKTVKRDIQFMRDHMDLPIAYDRNRHGYFYSKKVEHFPGAPAPKITEAELFALLIAHKALEQYKGTPFYQPLLMAFEKLTGHLNKRERYSMECLQDALSFRPFAPEDTDAEMFQTVTRALQERRVLQFEYRKPGEKDVEVRHVHVYHLTCSNYRWYVFAYDTERAALRTFVLGRISAPVLKNEHFNKPADFDPEKYLDGSLDVMKGNGDYEIVIEFDRFATDQNRGRQVHSTQVVTELPGGGSQMRLRLSGLEEIERWILSWGIHANVVAPSPLVDRLHSIAADLLNRYTPKN